MFRREIGEKLLCNPSFLLRKSAEHKRISPLPPLKCSGIGADNRSEGSRVEKVDAPKYVNCAIPKSRDLFL